MAKGLMAKKRDSFRFKYGLTWMSGSPWSVRERAGDKTTRILRRESRGRGINGTTKMHCGTCAGTAAKHSNNLFGSPAGEVESPQEPIQATTGSAGELSLRLLHDEIADAKSDDAPNNRSRVNTAPFEAVIGARVSLPRTRCARRPPTLPFTHVLSKRRPGKWITKEYSRIESRWTIRSPCLRWQEIDCGLVATGSTHSGIMGVNLEEERNRPAWMSCLSIPVDWIESTRVPLLDFSTETNQRQPQSLRGNPTWHR